MIDSIKKLGRWIIQVAIWLWERKIVVIALILLIGAISFILYMPMPNNMPMPDKTSVDRFRYTGLALELFGIFTVAYGLYETLKSSKRTLLSIISESFKVLPKHEIKNYSIIGSIPIKLGLSSLMSYQPGPDTPPDKQVTQLWKCLSRANEQIDDIQKIQQQLKRDNQNMSDALNTERSEREASVEKVRQMLKKFAVDGLAIEAIGVVCLVLGAVFATLSTELAYFFDSFPVLLKC